MTASIQVVSGTAGYLECGLAAARPVTPAVPTGGISWFYATDTTTLSLWNATDAAWTDISVGATPGTVTSVVAGTGLAGGTITSTGTITIPTQGGVTPGSFTNSNITVDARGIVTAAANGSVSGTPAAGTTWTAKTANYSVLAGDAGKDFINTGAAGNVNFSLPAAAANLVYGLAVDAAHTVTFTANGTDTIHYGPDVSAAGGTLASSQVGAYIRISAPKSGTWYVMPATGSWVVT